MYFTNTYVYLDKTCIIVIATMLWVYLSKMFEYS